MALIFGNEGFEGTGYEETWSGSEVIGGTSILDEDFPTSSVTGAPADWGSQCLKAQTPDSSEDAFRNHNFSPGPAISFVRIELIVGAEGLANNDVTAFFQTLNDSGSQTRYVLELGQTGAGVLFFRFRNQDSTILHDWGTVPSLNTRYRHEVKIDSTGDTYEWRIDGSTVASGSWTASAIGRMNVGIRTATSNAASINTFYYDNIAIDDTDWVGAVPGGGGATGFPPLLRSFDPSYLRI